LKYKNYSPTRPEKRNKSFNKISTKLTGVIKNNSDLELVQKDLLGKRVAYVVPSRQMPSDEQKYEQGKPPTNVHEEDQLDKATHTGVLRS